MHYLSMSEGLFGCILDSHSQSGYFALGRRRLARLSALRALQGQFNNLSLAVQQQLCAVNLGPTDIERMIQSLYGKLAEAQRAIHYAVASYLVTTFDLIVLPRLDERNIMRRRGRVFGSQSAQEASLLVGQGNFLKILSRVVAATEGKELLYKQKDVSDYLSTRSCPKCRKVVEKFAGELFCCSNSDCKFSTHRDLTACLNIAAFNGGASVSVVSVSAIASPTSDSNSQPPGPSSTKKPRPPPRVRKGSPQRDSTAEQKP